MHNLPVAVADEDIADMFAVADSDSDGRISYKEFQKMINPPKPPEGPKPTKQDFVKRFSQVISDQGGQSQPYRTEFLLLLCPSVRPERFLPTSLHIQQNTA